jgi:DNA repair exonuclease SbcCD ATPase subunit
MDVMELEAIVKNIDRRLSRVEQILPSLATKDDLREESERTRQHFNAVAERLESHIRLIAERHVALQERIEEIDQQFGRAIAALDQRVLRLEAR